MEKYLQLLYRELRIYFNNKEAEVIVNDYKEYFELGILEGKSIDELITQFGEPKKLVNELISDKVQLRKSSIELIKFKSIIIKFFYCAVIMLLIFCGQKFGKNLAVSTGVTLLVPTLACFWIYYNYSPILYFNKSKIKIIKKLCFLPLTAGVLYWLYNKGWFVYSYIFKFDSEFSNEITMQLGPSLYSNFILIKLIALTLILIFFFFRANNRFYKKSAFLFVLFGIIQTVTSIIYAFYDLTDFKVLKLAVAYSFIPLTIGLAAAIISYIFICAIEKREQKFPAHKKRREH